MWPEAFLGSLGRLLGARGPVERLEVCIPCPMTILRTPEEENHNYAQERCGVTRQTVYRGLSKEQ